MGQARLSFLIFQKLTLISVKVCADECLILRRDSGSSWASSELLSGFWYSWPILASSLLLKSFDHKCAVLK